MHRFVERCSSSLRCLCPVAAGTCAGLRLVPGRSAPPRHTGLGGAGVVVLLLCLWLCPGYGRGAGMEGIRVIPLPTEDVQPVSKADTPADPDDARTSALAQRLQEALARLRAKPPAQRPAQGAGAASAIAGRLSASLKQTAAPLGKPLFAAPPLGAGSFPVGPGRGPVDVRMRGIGTPRLLRGALHSGGRRFPLQATVQGLRSALPQSEEATARTFLSGFREYLRLDDPAQELQFRLTQADELGHRHLRFDQRFQSIPVWPADLIVHLDAAGQVASLSGAFIATPRALGTRPLVDAAQAEKTALALWANGAGQLDGPDLIIYGPLDRAPRLAWKMTVVRSPRERWVVVVDALNGKLLTMFNGVEEAAVRGAGSDLFGATQALNVWLEGGSYYMNDTSKLMFDAARSNPPQIKATRGGIIVQDARNKPETSDPQTLPPTVLVSSATANGGWLPDAVSAAFGFSMTYDYYLERHGRNSVDGKGGNIVGVVRLGKGFDNAFWASDLNTMFFGDAEPFAGALDVLAHELTHGVTSYTANLVYQGQSGALNEAFSDIFGEMVEAYVEGSNDWLLGSSLNAPIRNMKNPSALLIAPGLPYPEKMSQFIRTTKDNGGVHLNSGIINRAFYLLAEGQDQAIGRRDAERIFYRALAFYLTQSAQFSDARLACLQAAEELFGAGSVQVSKVAEAFDGVEVFDPGVPPDPNTNPSDVAGDDALLFVSFDTARRGYLLWRRELAAGDGTAGTPVSAGLVQAARPSVSADGRLAIYVNALQDACLLDTLRPLSGEQCLGVGGIHSVAMAPDGEHVAFILLDGSGKPSNAIRVVDATTGEGMTFKLVAPGSEGIDISSVVQADVMAFTRSGRFLIYDALNQIRQDDGSEVGASSIYAIDLATGQTLILVPPVLGEDIAHPSLSSLSDDFLTFETQDQTTGRTSVIAARLSSGQLVKVAETTGRAGPVFTGDDRALVFSLPDDSPTARSLYRQALAEDHLTPLGEPQLSVFNADYGAVYRRGKHFKLAVKLGGKGSGRVLSQPSGIDCGNTCQGLYPKGTRLRLTATADYGSKFVRWKGACQGKRGCRLKMKRARQVKAVFKPLPFYTLTVSKAGTGTGMVMGVPTGIDCGTACTATYTGNTVITLNALPDSSSVFRRWKGACHGTGPCRVKMSRNRKVSAVFRAR